MPPPGKDRIVAPSVATRPARELIEAVVRDAQFMADLTAGFLDRLGALPPLKQRRKAPVALPDGFLLELAAVLRIGLWERAGLRDRLGLDLPPADQVLDDLVARFTQVPVEMRPERTCAGIVMDVFRTTLDRLAWGGRGELHADVVLGEHDDELLLEALADVLWEQRHVGRAEG
jgi:hypothetical protein